jgi:hypothetical protein
MARFDAGACGEVWDEAHSVVRRTLSRDAFSSLCRELRTQEAADRGSVSSRAVAQLESGVPLPMGLGEGIRVIFTTTAERGRFRGPAYLMAKDEDGRWRWVRSDKE